LYDPPPPKKKKKPGGNGLMQLEEANAVENTKRVEYGI
jgi:hypothetical protein